MTYSSPVVLIFAPRIAVWPAEKRFSRPQIVRRLALPGIDALQRNLLRKKSIGILEQFQGRRKRCKDGPHPPYDVAYDANMQLKE